jgi:tetratricopeptide (TPR) repeat protein
MARALTETNHPMDAVSEYRMALSLEPNSIACLINFTWLLSAHRDAAIRRPDEAVQLAERAVAISDRRSVDALDALAAAYASAGRFDEAVRTGIDALRVRDQTKNGAAADDIRARVELYKRRIGFIVSDR